MEIGDQRFRSRRGRSVFMTALVGFFLGSLSAPSAKGRLNLPEVRQSIPLSVETSTALRDYFSHASDLGELPPFLQNSLLHILPRNLASACSDLMEAWAGEDARASALWRVRLLHHETARAWLAFHCASNLPHLADYHDERLALLRLDTGVVELLTFGPDAEDDDEVYQIEFIQRVPLQGAEGFSFRVKKPGNPCCDGPESRSQERLMIFADSPAGVVKSLSAIMARDDLSHCDDPEVDTETAYRAEIKYERDSKNFVAAVSAAFHEKVTDTNYESGVARPHTTSERSGTLQFRWDRSTFKFEQIR